MCIVLLPQSKTCLFLAVSMGQESGHGSAAFSASGAVKRLQLMNWPGPGSCLKA